MNSSEKIHVSHSPIIFNNHHNHSIEADREQDQVKSTTSYPSAFTQPLLSSLSSCHSVSLISAPSTTFHHRCLANPLVYSTKSPHEYEGVLQLEKLKEDGDASTVRFGTLRVDFGNPAQPMLVLLVARLLQDPGSPPRFFFLCTGFRSHTTCSSQAAASRRWSLLRAIC